MHIMIETPGGFGGPEQAKPAVLRPVFELAPETAAAINSAITIKTFGCGHGGGLDDRFASLKQIEVEFDVAAAVADSLDPARGDVLFVESLGCEGDYKNKYEKLSGTLERLLLLDMLRANRLIHAVEYAALRAKFKGIRVVFADMGPSEIKKFEAEVGYKLTLKHLLTDVSESTPAHTRREQCAVGTVAAHAEAALPKLGENHPTYALLFGAAHYDNPRIPDTVKTKGITHEFGQLGLNTVYEDLPSAYRARYLRQIAEKISGLPTSRGAPEALKQEAAQAGYEPISPMEHPLTTLLVGGLRARLGKQQKSEPPQDKP